MMMMRVFQWIVDNVGMIKDWINLSLASAGATKTRELEQSDAAATANVEWLVNTIMMGECNPIQVKMAQWNKCQDNLFLFR
jgi:hypothetical protein